MNAIRIFGGSNKNIPEAPARFQNYFSVVAEMYLEVPLEFFENVIALLKDRKYIYKVRFGSKTNVIALQYQIPN